MNAYSPFEKRIDDLQPNDLETLTGVSEGWHVEYKRTLVKPRDLAKAVSAFANTYGGWLFLGIEEQDKANPIAGSFPGISNDKVINTIQRLRDSVAEYLNPIPHFESHLLRGPCEKIELAKDRSVLVIHVPQSYNTPHVHKDGCIYRRNADSSDPKPEIDRFILDQLWGRTERIRQQIFKWVDSEPEFSEYEKDLPFVRLFLCIDSWLQRNPSLNASLPEVRNVMNSIINNVPSIRFETFYPSSSGFVARHQKANNPHIYGLTWRIQRNLMCEVDIPLSLYKPEKNVELATYLNGYNHASLFIDLLSDQGFTSPKVVDLNVLLGILASVVAKYRSLQRLADAEGVFHYKASVLNVWRTSPFIDISSILKEFQKSGIPLVLDNKATVPHGTDPDSFNRAAEPSTNATDQQQEDQICKVEAFFMFATISPIFGISSISIDSQEDTETNYDIVDFNELMKAGERAMVNQKIRVNRNQSI